MSVVYSALVCSRVMDEMNFIGQYGVNSVPQLFIRELVAFSSFSLI